MVRHLDRHDTVRSVSLHDDVAPLPPNLDESAPL